MKRNIFSMMAIAAMIAGSVSCAKEDPAQPLNQFSSLTDKNSARIKGVLLVNLDVAADADKQEYDALSNVQIKVTVSNSELYGQGSGAWATFVTTDGDGKFTVKVPATEDGVQVDFTASDTEGSQTQPVGADDDEKFNGVWKFNIPSKTVKSGMSYILDYVEGTFSKSVGKDSPVY